MPICADSAIEIFAHIQFPKVVRGVIMNIMFLCTVRIDAVAMKESWKPVSHSDKGLAISMMIAVKASVLSDILSLFIMPISE